MHASLLELFLHSFLDFLPSLDPSSLKILILSLESLFILGKRAVHDPVKVLLDLFDILLCTHEPLHEDVEFFVQSYDLQIGVGRPILVEYRWDRILGLTFSYDVLGGDISQNILRAHRFV